MNDKRDNLNLAHHETDELIEHLRAGFALPEYTRRWILDKLLALQEDRNIGWVKRLLKAQGQKF